MSKIIISEEELRQLVYDSTVKALNEGIKGKVIGSAIGNLATLAALGPGALALKGYHNFQNRDSMLDRMAAMSNDKSGKGTNGTNKDGQKKEEPKKDTYGKMEVYNDTNIPRYCQNFKHKDVLNGHIKSSADDTDKSMLYNLVNDVRKSEEERAKLIKKYLEDRDEQFKKTRTSSLEEGRIGTAIKAGAAALKLRRQMRGMGGQKNTLLNHNEKYNMIEREILPIVLNSLCTVLSIEKEDPMYQMIMSPATKKRMMKLIEKEI